MKNCNFSALFILFFCSILVNAQSKKLTDDIHIAKFKDDKACAISYTFDDGLKEHYTLVTPRLNKLGFRGTFLVNGSKINRDENTITDSTRMTWKDLKEMADSGQEISNHGWAHKNFGKFSLDEIKEDIYKNDSAILANVGIMPRTFAYPNNTKTPEGVEAAAKDRVGTRMFQRSVGGKSTPTNLESWVNTLQNNHDWGIGMTHGITYGYDHFQSPDIFWVHLEKVKAMEDSIWVGTFREVATYVRKRDSTTLQIKQAHNGHYIITPVCSLDKTLFAGLLTAVLEKNIEKVEICQGKTKLHAKIQQGKVIFDFDPFGEAVIIKLSVPNMLKEVKYRKKTML